MSQRLVADLVADRLRAWGVPRVLGYSGDGINAVMGALRWDSINLDTLAVAVDWQLDRDRTWPALALPKGNKPRTTQLWSCYRDVAVSLVEDALDQEGP